MWRKTTITHARDQTNFPSANQTNDDFPPSGKKLFHRQDSGNLAPSKNLSNLRQTLRQICHEIAYDQSHQGQQGHPGESIGGHRPQREIERGT